jgi:CMP-N,N'-diacetyllegionaminic acid synthase
MIAYSIQEALLATSIDRVIVSTDSKEYAAIAKEYGAEVPFLRPQEISGDNNSDYDFINHFLNWIIDDEGSIPTYLVLLRPTTPIREIAHIEKALKIIEREKLVSSLRSVQEMSESAYKSVEIVNGYLKCTNFNAVSLDYINSPRQKFPKTYHPDGYIDILKSSYIMKNKKIYGNDVVAYFSPFTVEIDTEDDFKYLEYYLSLNAHLVDNIFRKEI